MKDSKNQILVSHMGDARSFRVLKYASVEGSLWIQKCSRGLNLIQTRESESQRPFSHPSTCANPPPLVRRLLRYSARPSDSPPLTFLQFQTKFLGDHIG